MNQEKSLIGHIRETSNRTWYTFSFSFSFVSISCISSVFVHYCYTEMMMRSDDVCFLRIHLDVGTSNTLAKRISRSLENQSAWQLRRIAREPTNGNDPALMGFLWERENASFVLCYHLIVIHNSLPRTITRVCGGDGGSGGGGGGVCVRAFRMCLRAPRRAKNDAEANSWGRTRDCRQGQIDSASSHWTGRRTIYVARRRDSFSLLRGESCDRAGRNVAAPWLLATSKTLVHAKGERRGVGGGYGVGVAHSAT